MQQWSQRKQKIKDVNRKQYLETIGLAADPFANQTAEQELALSAYSSAPLADKEGRRVPSFFAYFTPPATSLPNNQTIIQMLRRPTTAFIYGLPGSGKTTLRYILEADCRAVLDGTLAVSYSLQGVYQPLSFDEHCQRLARELAVSLFIQVVEQFNPLNSTPTNEQVNALHNQLHMDGESLRRLAKRISNEPAPDPLLGLGTFWPAVGRTAVRYVARSQSLLELISAVLSTDDHVPATDKTDGATRLLNGLHAARLWGFERVFILVDDLDKNWHQTREMVAFVRSLLDKQDLWQTQSVFFKWFLPLELQDPINECVAQRHPDLLSKLFEVIIKWDEPSLRRLLKERFRAVGSRRLSFDDLAGPRLENQLDTLIFHAAIKTPRDLLSLISTLIDVHVGRDTDNLFITIDDWLQTVEQWGRKLPSLQPFIDT